MWKVLIYKDEDHRSRWYSQICSVTFYWDDNLLMNHCTQFSCQIYILHGKHIQQQVSYINTILPGVDIVWRYFNAHVIHTGSTVALRNVRYAALMQVATTWYVSFSLKKISSPKDFFYINYWWILVKSYK